MEPYWDTTKWDPLRANLVPYYDEKTFLCFIMQGKSVMLLDLDNPKQLPPLIQTEAMLISVLHFASTDRLFVQTRKDLSIYSTKGEFKAKPQLLAVLVEARLKGLTNLIRTNQFAQHLLEFGWNEACPYISAINLQTLIHSIQIQPELQAAYPELRYCSVESPIRTYFDFAYLADKFFLFAKRGVFRKSIPRLTSVVETCYQGRPPLIILCRAQYKHGELLFWSASKRKLVKRMRTSTNIYQCRGSNDGFFVLSDTSGVNQVSLVSGKYIWNYMYRLHAQNTVNLLGQPPNKLLGNGYSQTIYISCSTSPENSKLYVVDQDSCKIIREVELSSS